MSFENWVKSEAIKRGAIEGEIENKQSPELECSLEKIDFTLLKEAFSRKLRSLGLDSTLYMERFAGKDEIIDGGVGLGRYQNLNRRVEVNTPAIKKYKLDEDGEEKLTLSVVCHENVHSLSHSECEYTETIDENGLVVKDRISHVGYGDMPVSRTIDEKETMQFYLKGDAFKYSFLYLDEGITDMIAEDIATDYTILGEKNGNSADSDSSFSQKAVSNPIEFNSPGEKLYHRSYDLPRLVVVTMLDSIAENVEIPKETLWKIIQKGFFTNEKIQGGQVERLFSNIVSPDFFNRLEKWGGSSFWSIVSARNESMPGIRGNKELLEDIRNAKWSKEDVTRARRWLKKIAFNEVSEPEPEKSQEQQMEEIELMGKKNLTEFIKLFPEFSLLVKHVGKVSEKNESKVRIAGVYKVVKNRVFDTYRDYLKKSSVQNFVITENDITFQSSIDKSVNKIFSKDDIDNEGLVELRKLMNEHRV